MCAVEEMRFESVADTVEDRVELSEFSIKLYTSTIDVIFLNQGELEVVLLLSTHRGMEQLEAR